MNDVPSIRPDRDPFPPIDDDQTGALLREVLARTADRMAPAADSLPRIQWEIRARTSRRQWGWIGRLTPALTTAAAVAVLAVAGAFAVRLAQPPSSADQAHPDRWATSLALPPQQLAVYVVGHQDDQLRLFREFRTTMARNVNDRVSEAVTDAINLAPLDPDYDVRLFEGGIGGQAQAQVGDHLITVHITSAMATHPRATPAEARLAIQQLVWTATATADRSAAGVRIVVDHGTQSMFGRVALDRTFTRASGKDDPRAPLWVTGPADQTDIGHAALKVEGDAVLGSGGQVTWTLTLDDVEVDRGTALTTTTSGNRTKWWCAPRITKAGRYTITAVLHPGTGTSLRPAATGAWQDSKTFFVR